jgi:hypothetical protein
MGDVDAYTVYTLHNIDGEYCPFTAKNSRKRRTHLIGDDTEETGVDNLQAPPVPNRGTEYEQQVNSLSTSANEATEDLNRMDDIDNASLLHTGADMRILVTIFDIIAFVVWAAIFIYLLVNSRYDLSMFTYWSGIIVGVFFILLPIAIWYERWLITFFVLFVYPLAIVTTMIVSVAIVVIIKYNPAIYVDQGTSEGGSITPGDLHTGDWLLHVFPLVAILALGHLGFSRWTRKIIRASLASWSMVWRVLYYAYFLLVALIPLGIYTAVFGIDDHYPTDIPTPVLWLGVIALDLVWAGFCLAQAVVAGDIHVVVSGFGIEPSANRTADHAAIVRPVSAEEGTSTRRSANGKGVTTIVVGDEFEIIDLDAIEEGTTAISSSSSSQPYSRGRARPEEAL